MTLGLSRTVFLDDTDSLTQLTIKTKWSFNGSLIRLKWSRMEYHQFLLLALSRPGTHDRGFSLRGLVANGRLLPPVLLQAIVKSLIRFEREMVIEFTDNTVVLDMKYYQFYFMGWIGWDWEIKTNDYFGKVR